jgi:holin-like protein
MTMLAVFLTLLGCELVGEIVRRVLHLPIPGPVIGMLILAAGLALRAHPQEGAEKPALDRTASALLDYMGLLFVPAGVGIIAQLGLLRQEWLPILAGLLGSTVLSLLVTGFVMHRLGTTSRAGRKTMPPSQRRSGALS